MKPVPQQQQRTELTAVYEEMHSFLERFEDCLSNDKLREMARYLVARASALPQLEEQRRVAQISG